MSPASNELECPCCGDTAAVGLVLDGQALLCGCAGIVSMDAESDPEILIFDDDECPPSARCREI